MDLLNISYTEESSVLTKGEISFTLYGNMNMSNIRIMYCYFETPTITVGNFAFLFNCTPVGRTLDSIMVPT